MKPEDMDSGMEDLDGAPPELEIPEFRAHIKPEDLDDLSDRDRRMLLALSVVEQKLDFVIDKIRSDYRHIRRIETAVIRSRAWQRTMSFRWGVAMTVAMVIGTGLSTAVVSALAKKVIP